MQGRSAEAQISLQLGGSEDQFKAMLTQQGYDRIETKKLGIANSRFDACKGEKRYHINIKWTGEIETSIIGNCRILVTVDQITRTLEDRGYERISVEDRAGKFLAVACLRNQRIRVEFNTVGDIVNECQIGRCKSDLSPTDITVMLGEQGYDRIGFSDRRSSSFVALACLDREQFELRISRTGTIEDRRRVGRCQNDFSIQDITDAMLDQGYTNISVVEGRRNTFQATGCIQGRLTEVRLTKYGELIDRKDKGGCSAPRVNELADALRKRGLSNLAFFVEGCRGNRKERITFDEYANRIDRQVIGGC